MKTNKILLSKVRDDLNSDAWTIVFSSYQPLVRKWVGRFAGTQSEIEDISQEVFFTLIQELPKFEHNGRVGAFRNWLRQITFNRIRKSWQQQKRNPATGGEAIENALQQLSDPDSELSTLFDREHDEYLVKQILSKVAANMDATTMTAFRRFFVKGESSAIIANDLGISVAQVHKYKFRVLKKLKHEAKKAA